MRLDVVVDHEDPPEPGGEPGQPEQRRHGAATLTRLRRPRGRDEGPELVSSRTGARFTARAAVLLLVICALIVTLAYPLQQYLSQRSQIASMRARNADTTARNDQLRQDLADWNDPDYVRIQARLRLHYVLPGEIGFSIPGEASPTADNGSGAGALLAPWYETLWGSVQRASAPPTHGPPAPGPSHPLPQHIITVDR